VAFVIDSPIGAFAEHFANHFTNAETESFFFSELDNSAK
jgi:hypothetical protein